MRCLIQPQNRKPRHIPQRTCLGCRQVQAKGSLVRVVLTGTGEVALDPTGRKPGRGAYFCPWRDCWEAGLKGNRLEHVLRHRPSPASLKGLLEYGQTLPRRS